MEQATETISSYWQVLIEFVPHLVAAMVILSVFYFSGRILSGIVIRGLNKISSERIHDAFIRSVVLLICIFPGIILALNILGLERLALSLLAGGGVTAIILGFAFREIGENLLAGIFLAFSRPFKVGDLINSEGLEGKVKSIALRYTQLRAVDGRDIFIPSSQLFSQPLINYTLDGLRRYSFNIGIDYANDARNACEILQRFMQQCEGVLSQPPPLVTIGELEPAYVRLSVHYWRNVNDQDLDSVKIKINVMDGCRRTLLDNNFVVSADTTSNIAVSGSLANSGAE